jgi:hypothetical protein
MIEEMKMKEMIVVGNEVEVAHPVFGALNVRVMEKGSDEDGEFWNGRIKNSYSDTVKFRVEDVI